jgi:hypothetical protein
MGEHIGLVLVTMYGIHLIRLAYAPLAIKNGKIPSAQFLTVKNGQSMKIGTLFQLIWMRSLQRIKKMQLDNFKVDLIYPKQNRACKYELKQ